MRQSLIICSTCKKGTISYSKKLQAFFVIFFSSSHFSIKLMDKKMHSIIRKFSLNSTLNIKYDVRCPLNAWRSIEVPRLDCIFYLWRIWIGYFDLLIQNRKKRKPSNAIVPTIDVTEWMNRSFRLLKFI